jgi:outer membrane receptor for ferrienterochelin and colicin
LLNGVPSIKPERTTVVEAEMGYRLAKNLSVQGNVFFSLITGVIAFNAAQFVFINSGRTGSNGVEVELRYKRNRGYITANYSYYTSLQNNIASYATLRKNELLGAAQHKVGLNAYYSFMRDLGINVNGTFLSSKYAYTGLNTDGSPKMTLLNPTLLLNMYGQYNGLLNRKLGLGLGCYNILGANYAFAQAYISDGGGDAPIISTGREVSLKVTYTF